MISEFELIEKIKTWIPRRLQGPLGIGDDAALLTLPPGQQLVVTTDTLVDGVDFYRNAISKKPGFLKAGGIGRKALAVNLSDLAAMGAQPVACVISLGLPDKMGLQWIREFYRGLVGLAEEHQVLCVGGDISRAKEFFVSITAMGSVKPGAALTRSKACSGDWIGVTGSLGGSLVRKHFSFKPRISEATFLSKTVKVSSMIDLSDGLIQDLGHILKRSGVGAMLDICEIPISGEAVHLAGGDPMKALECACTDGEDFELLFTVTSNAKAVLEKQWRNHFPEVPLSWIGRVTSHPNKIDWNCSGKKMNPPQFKRLGYQHHF